MANYKIYLASLILGLQGCATSGWQSFRLQDYLQPYIGQSADQIQQNLNLRTLGFQTLKQPQRSDENLVFTVLRPINIPVPIAQSYGDASSPMSGSVRLGSISTSQQSYDVNFYCHIIFELDQQQIARSIRYEGKAC
ncbi:hypothetical protein NDN11_15900 [Acinetobacter sp. C26M]|uniref:hypothetical protein n=1 Tax=unclassified Acinetobacter TaxID=196816 RepID=UPI002036878C|nr:MULTISPECIES: hypothetical protein [unclassified Acinetobacter]USA46161.1 hypothetical protein NDN11_15900 [Acinetobacter sp. C26M]USA49645.1 hypothetical protein NDN12_15815 [Acinetobacter sp. C26G]